MANNHTFQVLVRRAKAQYPDIQSVSDSFFDDQESLQQEAIQFQKLLSTHSSVEAVFLTIKKHLK